MTMTKDDLSRRKKTAFDAERDLSYWEQGGEEPAHPETGYDPNLIVGSSVEVPTQNIPIRDPEQFEFTRNWFRSRNQKTWSSFFPPRFQTDEPQPINMIQIGVFEGMDAIWCLQNILTHPDSQLVCIDPWAETRKLSRETMIEVENRARKNLEPFGKRVKIIKGYSADVLRSLVFSGANGFPLKSFDLVVVDGDHTADAVFNDAMWANEFLKVGGWMVFDDVRNRFDKKDHVQDGLDRFMATFAGTYIESWFHRHCDCLVKVAGGDSEPKPDDDETESIPFSEYERRQKEK